MRSRREASFLNMTLDKIMLAINIQKKVGIHSENQTEQIIVTDLKNYVKINKYGLAEIALDTSDLQVWGSDDTIDQMDVIYTDYTFSINQNKLYEQAFQSCLRDARCTGDDYDSEEKIQSAMYKVIWENATASYDEMAETHDKLHDATQNETSKDTLYEMYHEFFTRTKVIPNTPKPEDFLTVTVCANPADPTTCAP